MIFIGVFSQQHLLCAHCCVLTQLDKLLSAGSADQQPSALSKPPSVAVDSKPNAQKLVQLHNIDARS